MMTRKETGIQVGQSIDILVLTLADYKQLIFLLSKLFLNVTASLLGISGDKNY